MAVADDIRDKRVTIVGLGILGGGVGVARYAVGQGARVTVTDMRDAGQLAQSIQALEGLPITYRLGGHDIVDFLPDGADIIVRNPGVPRRSEFLLVARDHGVPIEMEMSLFFRACPAPVIGVTGTKGKTTVSTLIGDMLAAWNPVSVMAGNMGISALAALERIDQQTPVVIELSSWQLEALDEHRLGPAVAVLTNIHEDHLTHYDGYEDYAATKRTIAHHLGQSDVAAYNAMQPDTARVARETSGRLFPFGDHEPDGDGAWSTDTDLRVRWDGDVVSYVRPTHLALSGVTGTANALAALAAATARGVPASAIASALAAFQGVPHRLEQVDRCGGVTFINDTSASAPIAAAMTIELLASRSESLTVIAGGTDKASDFGVMAEAIATSNARIVLLDGTGTERLIVALEARGARRPETHASLATAFDLALSQTPAGGAIVLSPGCASFGMFRNEFDRGEQFRQLVADFCASQSFQSDR
jgi:UDP-N-acetylmuramoylalanine--D-glutamate ligase